MLKSRAPLSSAPSADDTLSRRTFVLALAAAGAGALMPRTAAALRGLATHGRAQLHVRIALVAGDDEAAQHRMLGALMGVDEAQRSAALFGGSVEQTTLRIAAPEEVARAMADAGAGGATAVVGGFAEIASALGEWSAANGVPWLDSDGVDTELASAAATVFHVLPSHATREAALRAWLATPGAGAGWTIDADGTRATRSDGARAVVTAWDATLERFGGDQLNQRFVRWAHRDMDEWAWSGWVAAKAVWESALRARSAAPAAIAEVLASGRGQLDGHKGVQLAFDATTHELRQPLYVVTRDAAGRRLGVADVPRPHVSDRSGASRAR